VREHIKKLVIILDWLNKVCKFIENGDDLGDDTEREQEFEEEYEESFEEKIDVKKKGFLEEKEKEVFEYWGESGICT
jgi:hypothetical protein